MARLGVRTVDELVGRSEFLKKKEVTANPRASRIDLSAVLNHPYSAENNVPGTYDFELEKTLDETVLLQELGEKLKKRDARRSKCTCQKYEPDLRDHVWVRDYQTLPGRHGG